MNWWDIIKGSCCDACGNLNKGAGAVIGIGGSHDGELQPNKNKPLYSVRYGGERNAKEDEESNNEDE
tara:strand:+ start:354 stop:554 length:201 start_codon:yes stop_codon:yes gene_type:complete